MVKWIKKYLVTVFLAFMIFFTTLIFGVNKPKENLNGKLDQAK